MTPAPGGDGRTRIRRLPEKAVHDPAALHAVLDAGVVAHVSVVDDGQPFVLPVAYARDADRVLFHGSTGSRLFRTLAAGEPTCLTVTLFDGLVLARSTFESSMHYRSAMIFGACTALAGEDKAQGLDRIVDHLMPGRRAEARPPTAKELAQTAVLALPLTEWSLKVSAGPPADPPEDVGWPIWAGTLPIRQVYGDPIDAPDLDPALAGAVPGYIADWRW